MKPRLRTMFNLDSDIFIFHVPPELVFLFREWALGFGDYEELFCKRNEGSWKEQKVSDKYTGSKIDVFLNENWDVLKSNRYTEEDVRTANLWLRITLQRGDKKIKIPAYRVLKGLVERGLVCA